MEKSTLADVFAMKKLSLVLDRCISAGGRFVPQETLGNVWTHILLSPVRGIFLANGSGCKSGVLLNIRE